MIILFIIKYAHHQRIIAFDKGHTSVTYNASLVDVMSYYVNTNKSNVYMYFKALNDIITHTICNSLVTIGRS